MNLGRIKNLLVGPLCVFLLSGVSGDQKSDTGSGGGSSECSGECFNSSSFLRVSDLEKIIAQAVNEARVRGAKATIAAVDRVGKVFAVFRMNGSDTGITITSQRGVVGGLEGINIIPDTLIAMAVSFNYAAPIERRERTTVDGKVTRFSDVDFGNLESSPDSALGTIGNAPPAMPADQLKPQGTRLRFVQCPQSPYIDSNAAKVCDGL